MKKVAIVDIGLGNIGALVNIVKKIGYEAVIVQDVKILNEFNKIILPGVGSFDSGMNLLHASGFDNAINQAIHNKAHLLGICLGMQLLFEKSEEGSLPGLKLIPGEAKKFQSISNLKVPHMGWNFIEEQKENNLLANMPFDSRFYFVHSYYCVPTEVSDILATTTYGLLFASCVQRGNIYGVQFHPEKSHKFGMKLLENFMEM